MKVLVGNGWDWGVPSISFWLGLEFQDWCGSGDPAFQTTLAKKIELYIVCYHLLC